MNLIRRFDGQLLELTHLEKMFWKTEGVSKLKFMDYYEEFSNDLMPFMKDHPVSLHRFPEGVSEPGFFQKDVSRLSLPKWVKTYCHEANVGAKEIKYLVCNRPAVLLWMANLGCIEMHPWISTFRTPDKPDFMALDLDPEDIGFNIVTRVAQEIRQILQEISLVGYCKTSGSRGLHIYIPIKKNYPFSFTREFARMIGEETVRRNPKISSLERHPAGRQKKVYIDYLQNGRGQTLAAPYSLRPRPGATVSTPLDWKEVNKELNLKEFNIFSMNRRIGDSRKAWKNYWDHAQDLREPFELLRNIT